MFRLEEPEGAAFCRSDRFTSLYTFKFTFNRLSQNMATGRTLLVTLLCLYKCTISLAVLRPNILFVLIGLSNGPLLSSFNGQSDSFNNALIDDLGWNDVSYHGGSDFETPHLDELARGALQLNNYYVQHYCTPTRSALMSGRYPMRDGMQQWVIRSTSGYGMPLELTTLPEELKATGYSTHLLGYALYIVHHVCALSHIHTLVSVHGPLIAYL